MRTAQQIFDTVARHLLTQNARSLDGTSCAYRGADGLQCAIGCLIPDDVYSQDMEGHEIRTLWGIMAKSRHSMFSLLNDFAEHEELLCALQCIHDKCKPADWHSELEDRAARDGLEMPAVP